MDKVMFSSASDEWATPQVKHKIDVAARRELHQKYKRCLAMARICEYRWMNLEKMINTEYRTEKMRLSQRWWRIWFNLAEKFKEAYK